MPPLTPAESVARIQSNPDVNSRVAAQRAKVTDKQLEKGAAAGALALVILARRAPDTAARVLLGLSGIDVRKRGLNRFTKFAYGWLAPQPIGIVPPGFYGLSPGYLHDVIPGLPESEYLHTIGPDHPAMVKFQEKKNLRAKLQTAGPSITGGATSEAAMLLVDADLPGKIAAVSRWPGDLRHWFSHQLTGPHDHGAVQHTLTRTSALAGTLEAPAPLPEPGVVPAAEEDRADRKAATVAQLAARTAPAALATSPAEVVRVQRGRHVDIIAPSRAARQRQIAETRKAIETANAPSSTVGR